VRLSPSDGGRGDSTLPFAVSSRSATELTWGMKKDCRQASRQNGAKRYLTRRPLSLEDRNNTNIAFYDVCRVSNPIYISERKYANRPATWAPPVRPSTKVLITQW
jgi:hypothetical protein